MLKVTLHIPIGFKIGCAAPNGVLAIDDLVN